MSYKKYFQFSKVDHVEIFTFDPSLERFRQQMMADGDDVEGTVREIIQNSLDAKIRETEEPVKVNLIVTEVEKYDIPGIDDVFDHIQSLKPGNSYTSETVQHMKSKIEQQKVVVLTASDSNTQGLSGARKNDGGTYPVYAFNKGVHAKHKDAGTEKTRGGSHGVGKIANNAASEIHLMYFANCDEYGNKHLGGSVQLFDHDMNNQSYRGTGHYVTLDENGAFMPRINTHPSNVFQKNSRGLKIIIPYLRKELSKEVNLVKAVCNNFFVSIIENNLEVSLNVKGKEIIINDRSLEEIIHSYYATDVPEMKYEFLPLYYSSYLNAAPQNLQVTLPKKYNSETYNFKLYFFDENEEIPSGRTGIVRSIGMKIEDRKVPSHVRTPYNAVLIGGAKEDEYLKSLENESHTALSNEQIRDPEKKKKAKHFLNRLNKQLKEVIEESQNKKFEPEGEIDTSDLIYEMNWEFDGQINKYSEKVELTDHINLEIDNKKEKRKKHPREESDEAPSKEPKTKKRRPRKKQADPKNEKEVSNYILPPAIVNRAVIEKEEFITFRFDEIEGAEQWKKINLGLKLVNGQGEEIDDGISLTDLYTNITEITSGESKIFFDEFKMYDIPVYDGYTLLNMIIGPKYNANLKFVYKVEVVL
ncbi:hypothetical protein [Alkalibacterium sp.]|nr:MAG: hypothetical protein EA249_07780 [Alkalibacterium sp.]